MTGPLFGCGAENVGDASSTSAVAQGDTPVFPIVLSGPPPNLDSLHACHSMTTRFGSIETCTWNGESFVDQYHYTVSPPDFWEDQGPATGGGGAFPVLLQGPPVGIEAATEVASTPIVYSTPSPDNTTGEAGQIWEAETLWELGSEVYRVIQATDAKGGRLWTLWWDMGPVPPSTDGGV
jgi:hypothetical protein